MRGPGQDQVVAAAVTGERAALERLLATVRPFVRRYCRARVGTGSGAADAVARTVLRAVLDALPYYRRQDGPFLSFVYRIAAPMTDALAPASGFLGDRLPAQQREVLLLRVTVGLSAAETAAVLGCSDARVRLLQHRALTVLRAPQPRKPTANRLAGGCGPD